MKGSNYDVLLLRPQDIADVVDMSKAIDLVEQGYREAQDFPLINAPRRRVHSQKHVRISNFPGGVDGLGVIGSLTRGEQVNHDATNQGYPYREHPVYLLWNSETALLQCIMIGEMFRLEDAVRKMTSLPAQTLRLKDRGLLKEGYWADVVVFDPATVSDTATYENPQQYAKGVPFVLVNGTVVINQGNHTGARPGKIIQGPDKNSGSLSRRDSAVPASAEKSP